MVDQIRFFRRRGPDAGRPLGRGVHVGVHLFLSGASRSACARAVTPWNYPMMMAVWKWAPALAAGNTMVLKAVGHDAGLDAADGPRS